MFEPNLENRPFERLNFDDFPTLRDNFSLKMTLKSDPKNFLQNFTFWYPFERLNSFFREFCTPLRDFRVVKKVPLSLAHTRDLFLPKYPPRVLYDGHLSLTFTYLQYRYCPAGAFVASRFATSYLKNLFVVFRSRRQLMITM